MTPTPHLERMLALLGELQHQQQEGANLAKSYQDLSTAPTLAGSEVALRGAQAHGHEIQNEFMPQMLQGQTDAAAYEHMSPIAHMMQYLPPKQAQELAPQLLQHAGVMPLPDPNAALHAMGAKHGMSPDEVLAFRQNLLSKKAQSNVSSTVH